MTSSILKKSDTAPSSSELEVTIFGPGHGECIVLHLGHNAWFVIDSCIYPKSKTPIALEYLKNIGISYSDVRKVIATHFHDDHIRGMASVLRECTNAEFVMSAALSGQQFFQYVLEVSARSKLVKDSSSASEFAEILEILESRVKTPYVTSPSQYAQDGLRLFSGGFGGNSELWALSPSAATVANSHADLASQLLTSGATKRFKRFTPNHLSIAMMAIAGKYTLLLGADLERTPELQFGWDAVLTSTVRPIQISDLFKVAHHGSITAEHADVWTKMLCTAPIAVVTPFSKQTTPLPKDGDIKRIKAKSGALYCTTWPISSKPPRRRGVDSLAKSATKSRRAVSRKGGAIRLRIDLTDASAKPTIDSFGSAKKL